MRVTCVRRDIVVPSVVGGSFSKDEPCPAHRVHFTASSTPTARYAFGYQYN